MARDFDGSSGYGNNAGSLVSAWAPLTLACWFRPDADTSGTLMGVSRSDSAQNRIRLDIETTLNTIRGVITNNAGSSNLASSASSVWTSGTWCHAAAVFASSASRTIYTNGTAGTTETSLNTPSGTPDLTTIGAVLSSGGAGIYFNGAIAWAGIWNVVLTQAEITALASGIHPLLIRPGSLLNAYDLGGTSSPEPGHMGYSLTLSGSSVFADSPRIFLPKGRSLVSLSVGSALASGTASGSATGTTTASLSVGAASGGTAPYTYQWYRDTTPGFTPSGANDVVGATSTTLNDTGLTLSTTYYYKVIATDNVAATSTSNEVELTTTSGAAVTARNRVLVML